MDDASTTRLGRIRSRICLPLLVLLVALGLSACSGNSEAARAIEDGAGDIDGVDDISVRDVTALNPTRVIELELNGGIDADAAAEAIERVLELTDEQDWGNGDFTVKRGDGATLYTDPTTGVTAEGVADWFRVADALPKVSVSSARAEDVSYAGLSVRITAEDVPEAMRTAAELPVTDVASWAFLLDDGSPSYLAQSITVPEVTDEDIAIWERIDATAAVDPVVEQVWRVLRTDTVLDYEVRVRVAGDPPVAELDTDSLEAAITKYANATGITDDTVERYPKVAFDVWYAGKNGVILEPLAMWSSPGSGRPAKTLDAAVAAVLPRVS